MQKTVYILVLFFIISWNKLSSQNLFKVIEKCEDAVFTVVSYGDSNYQNDTASGFFINPDGIAIVPAHIFQTSDSCVIALRNKKKYNISSIISTHPIADLCMVKIDRPQNRKFDYMVPTQKAASSQGEVLILCHPDDGFKGLTYGKVNKVFYAPYLNRFVEVKTNLTSKSDGAPVINNSGELIGVSSSATKRMSAHYMSTRVLSDSLWIPNNETEPLKNTIKTSLYMNEGLVLFMNEEWIEAAELFSKVLKKDSLNLKALVLRGEARRQYDNKVGSRIDLTKATQLDSTYFLLCFFKAHAMLDQGDKKSAFLQYIKCVENCESFSPGMVEFGLLMLDLRDDRQGARDCFELAIKNSPLYANAYYELSRLLFMYYEKDDEALAAINKAIYLDDKLPGVYSIRGTLKMQFDKYFDAIPDFDKALMVDKNDTHAWFNRGVAYYKIGIKEKCCADWQQAAMLGHSVAAKYISSYCKNVEIDSSIHY